jgi:hypothetical protein
MMNLKMDGEQMDANGENRWRYATSALAIIFVILLCILLWPSKTSPASSGNSGGDLTSAGSGQAGTGDGTEDSAGGSRKGKVSAKDGSSEDPAAQINLSGATNQVALYSPGLGTPPRAPKKSQTGSGKPSKNPGKPNLGKGNPVGPTTPTFMGLEGKGNSFVFIIDMSGSMSGQMRESKDTRFEFAKKELIKFVSGLKYNQKFFIFFYSGSSHPMEKPIALVKATPQSKVKAIEWITKTSNGGGTNPLPSLREEIILKSGTIWLLTDGQFSIPPVIKFLQKQNQGTIVNTIALGNPAGLNGLQRIANLSGGKTIFHP